MPPDLRLWRLTQRQMEPRYVVPLAKLVSDSGEGADGHEAGRQMQPHTGLIGQGYPSIGVAVAGIGKGWKENLVQTSADAGALLTSLHVDRCFNRPLVGSALAVR